jgi:enoyl-CoA hydratase/carnithine racemase
VRTSIEDKLGTLALDNDAKRNALGAATVAEMLRALEGFDAGLVGRTRHR